MYEHYYGFSEKPFSLTPDPKYLYRSESHASAFELLQYAIRRREGFAVITGDIGTGKTTLCRALLEQIDRATYTALVLNPFLSEEDLLKRILLDFGVVSKEEMGAGRLSAATKQALIDTLYDFLLGLISRNASAVLIIDEAQNLPREVLEQIRILSNLETDKEKLLQIILVGQLNLRTLLRSPNLRQLDQRVSIRYELKPLDRETVAAYVAHRLTIAGGSAAVTFSPKALEVVHRLSGGIPRLINLVCDRALLAAFSVRASRITPEMVEHAAESLELNPTAAATGNWLQAPAPVAAGALAVLLGSSLAVAGSTVLYQRFAVRTLQASASHPSADTTDQDVPPSGVAAVLPPLPATASATVLMASYPLTEDRAEEIRAMADWLEASGYAAYEAQVDLGEAGRWRRVLAGAYTDLREAAAAAGRLRVAAPGLNARALVASPPAGIER